jgi:hypothetical protein
MNINDIKHCGIRRETVDRIGEVYELDKINKIQVISIGHRSFLVHSVDFCLYYFLL